MQHAAIAALSEKRIEEWKCYIMRWHWHTCIPKSLVCMALPVAMMVTEKQSKPYVTHFLRQFRHWATSLKGLSAVTQPMQINTDWSQVMINSVLGVFNYENLQEYLSRLWKLLNIKGKKDDFSGYPVLYVCLRHHMKILVRMVWWQL